MTISTSDKPYLHQCFHPTDRDAWDREGGAQPPCGTLAEHGDGIRHGRQLKLLGFWERLKLSMGDCRGGRRGRTNDPPSSTVTASGGVDRQIGTLGIGKGELSLRSGTLAEHDDGIRHGRQLKLQGFWKRLKLAMGDCRGRRRGRTNATRSCYSTTRGISRGTRRA
jgi:hypothetical protein